MYRIIILIILLWLIPSTTLAGTAVNRFDHWSIEDGLSQSSTLQILQDSTGYLWFGTADGLNRYDGYSFKIFRHNPNDPTSISSEFIRAMALDSKGRLWIGTASGGLNRYDADTEQFIRFKHDPSDPHSLSDNHISSIAEDSQGNLWIGTLGGGLNQFNASSEQFTHFRYHHGDPNSLSHDNVTTLLTDSQDNLWIGTNNGLNQLTLKQKPQHFIRYQHNAADPHRVSHNKINALLEDSKGTLWVGTSRGLNQFKNRRFHLFKQATNDLSHHDIRSLFEDTQHNLWVGTYNGGLIRYGANTNANKKDHNSNNFTTFKHDVADPHSLSADTVLSIFEDNQGSLWFGTYGAGINKLDQQKQHFNHYQHKNNDLNSLTNNVVFSIFKDSRDLLWIGTLAGLSQYDNNTHTFQHFKHQPTDPNSLSHNMVMTVYEDSQGMIWLGTQGGGLNRYDEKTRQFVRFKHSRDKTDSLSHDVVLVTYEDSQGTLWIGTQGGGLNQYNPQNQTFTHHRHHPTDAYSLSHDTVRAIFEYPKGTLWLATDGGLNQFEVNTGRFTSYMHDASNPQSLSHNFVSSIQSDNNGNLWLGTYGGGLNRFNLKSKRFERYRVEHGLPNSTVYGVIQDQLGLLWLSTNNGLSRFDPATKSFRNYDVNDGLQSNEFNLGAYFQAADGELFFGGIGGFNRFFPQNIVDDKQPPMVVFTDFLLDNQSVPIGVNNKTSSHFVLAKNINNLEHLTLDYQQKLISFAFSTLHFANPTKNQYAWQLVGQDLDWIKTDADNRRATYTNLSPGDYTLRIKASNHHGYWDQVGKSLKITVLPPPWRTWWAYLLYVLAVLALMALILWVLTERRKRINEHTLLGQLQQVDKIKDEFLANTSHELRTPLNGIIGLTESLINGVTGPLEPQTRQQLSMVVSSGRRLSNLINDILDFAKLDSHSLTLNRQPVDLNVLVKLVLSMSYHLIGDKQLSLVNQVADDLPAVDVDQERLQQVFYNLIGNAIKFSEHGKIIINAIQQDQQLKITISDNGIGIAQDKFDDIFKSFKQLQGSSTRRYGGTGLGLAVSKELIALHGSDITVESTLGQGSTFSFMLPIAKDSADNNSEMIDRLQLQQAQAAPQSLFEPLAQASIATASVATDKTNADSEGTGHRLLLVDDEPINRLVLHNHLSQQPYHLVEAASGEEALSVIENNGPFDLVLLDIMMPKMSGYEVCEKLRQTYLACDLPVIFLTAKNQTVDMEQSFAMGANDFLNKPVTQKELVARIETHLNLLDIHRSLKHQLKIQTAELLQSEKMASLGHLISGVAHELNNPAHIVSLSAENLEISLARCEQYLHERFDRDALDNNNRDNNSDSDKLEQKMKPMYKQLVRVIEGTQRIRTIVKDLRTFGQLDPSDKQAVKVTDLLTSTLNLIRTKYSHQTQFITEFVDHPELICYPSQLNQVFMNLVINACDAIGEQRDNQQQSAGSGQVTIGCRQFDGELGQTVEISVKDNGAGMSKETQSKLFDPFYTTKRDKDGTGLGLSISFGIVQKHGGRILVESELSAGTTFTLHLPCTEDANRHSDKRPVYIT